MNALQLVSFNEEGQAILHLENLQSVLDRDEIRDRRVVAIAVAGSFRRGKSFLLNYFLRYLETKGDKSFKEDDKLSGFESKFGLDRVTTGISIWPEVFIVDDLAVVLIDTQGTFDKETSMKVNTAVVAFSALISSVQIFNYYTRLDAQDFMNLEFFIKYGELLARDNPNQHGTNFFQKFLFLIRDWNEGYGFSYGYDGGDGYLQHFVSSKNSNEMQSSNEMLRMCFDEVLCYLMPHPGEAVSDSQTYNGHLKDVDGTFLDYIHSLASSLLSPENLVSKRIAGELVTSGQLMHHIRACVSLFNSNELPEPKTMYNILVDEVSGANSKEAREMYCNLMKEAMKSNVLDEEQLNTIHQQNSTTAMEYFTNKQKMGSDSQKIKHKTVLHENIRDDFLRFAEMMRHQREIKGLRIEMETQRTENEKLKDIVQRLQIDVTEKQAQIDLQNQSIQTLQDKMQEAENLNEVRDKFLKTLQLQFDNLAEMNEEQQKRNEELKSLIDEQSQKMRKLEDELEEEMKSGFFTTFARKVAVPIAGALDKGIQKISNSFKNL